MKHFSKIIALLLCLVFALSACKSENEPTSENPASPSGETVSGTTENSEKTSGGESEEAESTAEKGEEGSTTSGGEEGPGKETTEEKTSAKAAGENAVETTEADEEELESAFLLREGVYVLELFPYSGAFIEDGSNEKVEKIAAVTIVNTSDEAFQILDFTLRTESGKFSFRATTLLPGTRMTVLNSKKKKFDEKTIKSGKVILEAPFSEAPSIRSDRLKISFTDGFVNAQNVSDEKLENVYIYYKSTNSGGFFGGITYRVHIEEIEKGTIVQARTKNIRSDSSEIVFVTFA